MKHACKAIVALASALALLAIGGCSNDSSHPPSKSAGNGAQPVRLSISGSSTMAPLVAALAQRFESLYPAMKVDVKGGGSKQGVTDARTGVSHIGMASRNLNDEEQDLQSFPIARDGIGMVVHKDNPITGLSTAQVVAIYTGQLANWKQVGGKNAGIFVISRKNGYSSLELFIHYFKVKEEAIKANEIIGDNAQVLAAVAADPQAISFVSIGEAERNIVDGMPLKLLAIDGVTASTRNVRTGNYPILRPLILITKKLPEGETKQFIDFCLSSQATDLVQKFHFIPYMD